MNPLSLASHLTGRPLNLTVSPKQTVSLTTPDEQHHHRRLLARLIEGGALPLLQPEPEESQNAYFLRCFKEYAHSLPDDFTLQLMSKEDILANIYDSERLEEELEVHDLVALLWTGKEKIINLYHFVNDPALTALHPHLPASLVQHLSDSSPKLGMFFLQEAWETAEQAWWSGCAADYMHQMKEDARRSLKVRGEEITEENVQTYILESEDLTPLKFEQVIGKENLEGAMQPLPVSELESLLEGTEYAELREILALIPEIRELNSRITRITLSLEKDMTAMSEYGFPFNVMPTYILDIKDPAQPDDRMGLVEESLHDLLAFTDDTYEEPVQTIHLKDTPECAQHFREVMAD